MTEARPIWGGFAAQDLENEPATTPPIAPGRGTVHGSPAPNLRRHAAPRPESPATPAPIRSEPRAGSLRQPEPIDASPNGTVVLRINRRVATIAGSACAAALCAALVLIGGQIAQPARAGASLAMQPDDFSQAVPLALRLEQSEPAQAAAKQPPALSGISADEYGRQVAIATLTSGLHEITNTSVTLYRDPDQPGNAVQQFARKFGRAIATGRNPTPLSAQDPR